MKEFKRAVDLLPGRLRAAAERNGADGTEEIRLRRGTAPTLLRQGREIPFAEAPVTQDELDRILERATGASLHAVERAIAEGYLSYRGLRIGICGTAAPYGEHFQGFSAISSLAIRIPRECRGLCTALAAQLYPLGYRNTLILSPPGGGKTTALRDLIRCLSERGFRLGVVDERFELASADGEGTGYALGRHTDVLAGVPKAEGGMMLLRAMNPEIIAMDEISSAKDVEAVEQIFGCGVGLLATAHARDAEELLTRPLYRPLVGERRFGCALVIRLSGPHRSYTVERLGA